MTRRTAVRRLSLLLIVGVLAGLFVVFGRPIWTPAYIRLTGGRTVADVIDDYGEAARSRMAPAFEAANVDYPPSGLTLLAMKDTRELEVWADTGEQWQLVHTYPILGASGVAGPKLRRGDSQVPEGIYRVEGLNPNSSLHLSMKLDYPNEFDTAHGEQDKRDDLGDDIFIHGGDTSVGCISIGDSAIEELFVLVDDVGTDNVTVVIAPSDPRSGALDSDIEGAPEWLPELYELIEKAFGPFARN